MKKALLLGLLLLGTACTQQGITRKFGGITTIQLAPGEALVNVSWKEHSLWVLVKTGDHHEYREYSAFGLIQGKVIIK